MAAEISNFVKRLHEDDGFRARFAAEPAAVLAEAGIEPDALALPEKIDAGQLQERLSRLFSGKQDSSAVSATSLAELGAQELWDRFGAIAWKADDRVPNVAVVVQGPPISVVVVYGVSMAIGSNVAAGSSRMMSVEQMATLRSLARQPLPQLSFSITGPDGVKVDGISASALEAFLQRASSKS